MYKVAIAALVLLAACSQRQERQPSLTAEGCARSATHEAVWSNPGSPDTITARAEGPNCAQAVVTLVVRNANGDPLWQTASTFYEMTTGARTGTTPVSEAEMDAFLASWADVTEKRSSDMPAWPASAASLSAAGEGLAYSTKFTRESYERARGADLPLICYAAGVEASQCLIIDPANHEPAAFVAIGV